MTDGHSMADMEDKIDAASPFRFLAIASYEPVLESSKRLSVLYEGWDEDELLWMLRAALVQAHLSLTNQTIGEQFAYHELCRWFVSGNSKNIRFSDTRYQNFLKKSLEDQELKQFVHSVVLKLNDIQVGSDYEADANRLELIARLTSWAEANSPKVVYFGQYAKSPLRQITLSLSSDDHDLMKDRLIAAAYKICPDNDQESFIGYDERDIDVDEQILELAFNEQERRLFVRSDMISMELNPEQFDSWEDTVRPFAANLIEAAQSDNADLVLHDLCLIFENELSLPPESDLSDFFYMLPELPQKIVPPAFMREQRHAYYFPQKAMRGSYSTDLLYDSFGQYLNITFRFEPRDEHLEVRLNLMTRWSDKIHISQVLEQLDAMKNNLNAAFHSVIKDRTRALFN